MKYTPAQDQQGEREEFVSDLFHALAQPLTGLRCSLEVALRRPALSAEEARSSLEQALQATERLYQSVLFVRQLADAERTPPLGRVRLDQALRELHNEILPIGENLEVELSLEAPDDIEILASAENLSRALFLVADFALRELRAEESLSFAVLRHGASARLRIERHCDRDLSGFELPRGFDIPPAQRGLALAFRLLSSMGARVEADSAGKWIEIRFRRNDGDSPQVWNIQPRAAAWESETIGAPRQMPGPCWMEEQGVVAI